MRLWPFTRLRACPSKEAAAADAEATRALTDAKALTSRADCVANRIAETARRNGFAAAVLNSFRGV